MKRIFFILAIAAVAAILPGCTTNEDPTLEISITEMTLTQAGETETVEISSGSDWIATYDSKALQVTPNSGKGGKTTTVTIELLSENATASDVKNTITVVAGKLSGTITVIQPGVFINISPESLSFSNMGEEKSFTVTANCQWSINTTDLPSWITSVTPTEGDSDATVTVATSANTNRKDTNTHQLRIEYSTSYTSIALYQEPAPNIPPTAAVPEEPADNATGVSIVPLFKWQESTDQEGDSITYTVMCSTDGTNWWTLYTGAENEFKCTTALTPDTQYFYKIISDDGCNDGTTESEVYTFTTGQKDAYQDGEYEEYMVSSKPNPIVLVFTGDGYIAEDHKYAGAFDEDIETAIEALFAIEPYKSYRDYFTVYKLAAYSQERGTDNVASGTYSETVYSTKIEGGNSTGIECDYDAVFAKATKIPGVKEEGLTVCVVINYDFYAGTCSMWFKEDYTKNSSIAMITKNETNYPGDYMTKFENTVRHELGGHGFAFLFDEYFYPENGAATQADRDDLENLQDNYNVGLNLSATSERTLVPWARFFDTEGYSHVGIYDGGYTFMRGIWRSEYMSCMIDNREYFNSQSRYLIVKRILDMCGEEFTFETFLAKDIEKTDNTGYAAYTRSRVPFEAAKPLAPPVIHIR